MSALLESLRDVVEATEAAMPHLKDGANEEDFKRLERAIKSAREFLAKKGFSLKEFP